MTLSEFLLGSAFNTTNLLKRSIQDKIYLFPLSVCISGPTKSIATVSNGCLAIIGAD